MHKADLKRNLEAELLKIERQDKKIYGVGETRYDLMIKDVLIYIDNSISKEVIKKLLNYDKTNYIDCIKANNKIEAIREYIKHLEKELLEGK